ncbi:MAG: rhodanese-like protein [Massilia sp.]|jgi:rhodanese-related sulfurtransferase|nr:rhodanese-like protein [Massilia sp.]
MKTLATLAVAALILSVPAAQAQQPAAAAATPYKSISSKLNRNQIDGLLGYPDQVLIVDVRRPDEITTIGGFPAYLSVQAKDLEASVALIPRDRTIITVSNHANRALKAADTLLAKGFKVAGAAGVQDYEAEGGKLTKIAAPAPKVASAAP